MSKRYKGQTCIYCLAPGCSSTGDHVIAREFFPENRRMALPVVPACEACNNEKSKLEHYATAVTPFGAQHANSVNVLASMVPPRLEKNLKLARSLRDGMQRSLVSGDGGRTFETQVSLPFDGQKFRRLLNMITRGLAFHEFGVLLPDADCAVFADFLGHDGRQFVDGSLAQNGRRVAKSLGGGIFDYEAVQSFSSPQITVWRMSFGGMVVAGDPRAPSETTSAIGAITALRRMKATAEFIRRLEADAARMS
jgi:hypothetical protein